MNKYPKTVEKNSFKDRYNKKNGYKDHNSSIDNDHLFKYRFCWRAFLCVLMAIIIFSIITSLSFLSIVLSFLMILIFTSFIAALIKYLNLEKDDKSIRLIVTICSGLGFVVMELTEGFVSFANIMGWESASNFFSSAEDGSASLEDIIKAIGFVWAVSFPVSYFLIGFLAKHISFYEKVEQFLCETDYKWDLRAKQKELDRLVKEMEKLLDEIQEYILNSKKEEMLKKHLSKRSHKFEKMMEKRKKYLDEGCQLQDCEKLQKEVYIISKIKEFLQIPSPSDENFLELQKTILTASEQNITASEQKYLSQ